MLFPHTSEESIRTYTVGMSLSINTTSNTEADLVILICNYFFFYVEDCEQYLDNDRDPVVSDCNLGMVELEFRRRRHWICCMVVDALLL